MFKFAVARSSTSLCRKSWTTGLGHRFISNEPTHGEAYLRPVATHPGVAALLLNRPASKNAISTRLLKVGHGCEACSITWTDISPKELTQCLEEVHYDNRSLLLQAFTSWRLAY